MLSIVNKSKALPIVARYYNKASVSGYVPHVSVKRMMAYMFLISFIEIMYPYIDDDDSYRLFDRAFVKLFTDGGCLFPYQAIHANYLQLVDAVGKAHYMGNSILRITTDGVMRETENNILRRMI